MLRFVSYERYIGFLREQAGARVTYQGIFSGLEDLGRDLLAERDGTIEVIQCKRWARHKTVHEKHVFQLFGTVVAARIEYPGRRVTGTFHHDHDALRARPRVRSPARYQSRGERPAG